PATENEPLDPDTMPVVVVPSPQLIDAVKSLAASLVLESVNVATVVLDASGTPSVAWLSTICADKGPPVIPSRNSSAKPDPLALPTKSKLKSMTWFEVLVKAPRSTALFVKKACAAPSVVKCWVFLVTPFSTIVKSRVPNPLPKTSSSMKAAIKSPLSGAASDRKSTRLNSSHVKISYAVFCLKKKNKKKIEARQQHSLRAGRRYKLVRSQANDVQHDRGPLEYE